MVWHNNCLYNYLDCGKKPLGFVWAFDGSSKSQFLAHDKVDDEFVFQENMALDYSLNELSELGSNIVLSAATSGNIDV